MHLAPPLSSKTKNQHAIRSLQSKTIIGSLPGKAITKLAPKSMKNSKFIKGSSAAANQIVPMAGVHLYGQYKTNQEMDNIAKSLEQSQTVPEYDPNEI